MWHLQNRFKNPSVLDDALKTFLKPLTGVQHTRRLLNSGEVYGV